ncbi:Cof-type HAD-IIB family hydrolase [Rummeliibacillus pycnus]|uniref:Cof-type HAD-IIB family hydrolase n=1 Tax=Rummeliibacillus pycnus TaxID=101070 RepID=UPI0037C9903D
MNVKIIFFDLDGTLINYEDGSISPSSKKAIQILKSNGIRLVAATGRPLSMCQELKELGIDTFITVNGAYVKHKDRVIHKIPVTKDVVQAVKDFADENKQSLLFFTEELSMNRIQNSTTFLAMNETLSLHEFPNFIEEDVTQEIYLMCLYADETTAEKYTLKFPDLIFRRWHPFIVNVLQQDVSKSIAVKKVLDHFNIKPSEAIAFGDGENDIDMLEQVGYGIAMGNAHETLKNVADFVTKKSNEDGIEFALQKLQLI